MHSRRKGVPRTMTPPEFIAKWSRTHLPERSASQEHFIDLCRLLGQPTPAEHDATGAEYAFEKGVPVTDAASAGAKGLFGYADVPPEARALIRHSAIMARAAQDKDLKTRTLTNLYNQRPTWLKLAHRELDRAVLAAYAAVDPAGEWPDDWSEVWQDTGAGQPLAPGHPLAARRAEVDQKVLANLLRLNQERAGEGMTQ